MKSSYERGYERGHLDALNYRKKDATKGLSLLQRLGVSKRTQDYIVGYNNGYYAVLNRRKEEKERREAQEILAQDQVVQITDDSHLQNTETDADLKKERLKKTKELQRLKKQMEKITGSIDLEL